MCISITGHTTDHVIEHHYFSPDAETTRKALLTKMPSVLTGVPADSKSQSPNHVSGELKEWLLMQLAALTPVNCLTIASALRKRLEIADAH